MRHAERAMRHDAYYADAAGAVDSMQRYCYADDAY